MLIKPGSQWRITGFRSDLSELFRRNLLSLGFVPGAVIDIVRFAPLGDPAEVRLSHSSYALRKAELAMLRLEAVDGGEQA